MSIPSRTGGKIGDAFFQLPEGKLLFVPVGTDIDTMSGRTPYAHPPIPSSVTERLSYIDTNSLYYNGNGKLYPSFPKNVYTQKRTMWENPEEVEVLPPGMAKKKTLLYYGTNRRDRFYISLGFGQRPIWTMNDNDFGPGLYFYFDPMIATACAGSGGVLIAVDWTREGAPLTKKFLGGEEWVEQVKNYRRMGTTEGNVAPQPFEEDFVIGAISANHDHIIRGCEDPVAGTDEQVMARTTEACDYMSRNLVSVIWFE